MLNGTSLNDEQSEVPMSCDAARRIIAGLDVSEARRREIAVSIAHVEGCESCGQTMDDFDRIYAVLRRESSDSPEAEPRGGWGEFEKRMQGAMPSSKASRINFMRPLPAIAAAILFALGGFFLGNLRVHPQLQAIADRPPAARQSLSLNDVARQLRAFGEVDRVFDGHIRWLLLTGAEPDLALDDADVNPAPAVDERNREKIVLLRLDLFRDNEMACTADLMIIAGKTAEIRLPMKDGTTLRYRLKTSGSDPSQLGLRAELRSNGGAEAQASLATELQLQPNRDTSAGQLIAPSGRYDLKVLYASALNEGQVFDANPRGK